MDINQLIVDFLPHFVPQEATEESVFEILIEQQVPYALATQIILFVPVAFGRAYMRKFDLDFPVTFILNHPDNTTIEGLPFADEPVYNAAYELGVTIIDRGEWQDDFHFEVASWSSEMNVVSQALVEGYPLQSFVLQELHVNGDIGSRPISPLI
ncbi:hypothetical protein EI293_08710 [Hymenobacter perfusus]|uniref:Uncharacterized protein n=2 Tax=Hymenobacter perfusus TaxID=1236770 RepID=A0A3R9NDB1_9BACT|nr:hypothetical protein EI293_08710 [Hymenobacter perfusus]